VITTQSDSKKSSFKNIDMGEFYDEEEGIRIGFTDYQASDGTTVTFARHTFESTDHAREYLNRVSLRAEQVIRREPKKNKKGEIVGERVQATYSEERNHQRMTELLWTIGPEFYEVFSDSPRHVLEFEKTVQ
jgi:hypothetical protein